MKLTRKLFVSILAVAFALMALGTSTFAWFSMNTVADAENLKVGVKSNATYLLISNSEACTTVAQKAALDSDVDAAYITGGTVDETDSTLYRCYPCAYQVTTGNVGEGTDAKEIAAGKWYTASNKNSNSADDAIFNVTEIDDSVAATFNKYVLTYKVWLTLSADSEDITADVNITFSKKDGDDAVSTVVVIGDDKQAVNVNTTTGTFEDVALSAGTATLVTIYVYVDGNAENVNSLYINGDGGSNVAHDLTGIVAINFELDNINE